jgi:SHS2 domain-containing protein
VGHRLVKRYEFIEHTADVAVKAYGATLEEAFAIAAGAMFDIITDESPIERKQKVELKVKSMDMEGLLVNFLSRLIVLHEVDHLVLKDFDVAFTGDNSLRAAAWGEKFTETKHGGGLHVKGVSYHMMEVVQGVGNKPCHVQVLFDV